MNLFNYTKLQRRYNELLTKYDIVDDLPELIAKKSSLVLEITELSKNIGDKKSLLGEYESLEALSEAVASKREEIALLEEQIGKLKSLLDNLETLEEIQKEIESLEKHRKILQSKGVKKYDPGKIIYATYKDISNDDAPYHLTAFVYQGEVKYTDDDDDFMCSEYKSIGGWATFAVNNFDYAVLEAGKKSYNSDWGSLVSFEEVCMAIGSKLYLESEVTGEEIMEIMSVFDNYDINEENLEDILSDIKEKAKEKRKERRNKRA